MFTSNILAGIFGIAALGVVGVAASANDPQSAAAFACGVSTATERGMLVVEGIVQSPTVLSGEYRFSLKSIGGGGSTNVNQGGQFSVAPGTAVSLGRVMVNAGASVDVDFSVSADGKRLDCSSPLQVLS